MSKIHQESEPARLNGSALPCLLVAVAVLTATTLPSQPPFYQALRRLRVALVIYDSSNH
jgi:hypothetical protein